MEKFSGQQVALERSVMHKRVQGAHRLSGPIRIPMTRASIARLCEFALIAQLVSLRQSRVERVKMGGKQVEENGNSSGNNGVDSVWATP